MSHQQITLAQFRASVQAQWESTPFLSDTETDRAINETLRWWNLFTGYWRKIETQVTVANQVFYALASTLVLPARVHFSSYPLDIGSLFDLNQGRPNWRAETTASGIPIPTRPAVWAPVGLKQIAIWPADAVGGITLVIDSVRATPILTADLDYIDIGREEFSTLSGEVIHIAAFKQGGDKWQGTIRFHQEFLKAAMERNAQLYASAFFRRAAGIDTGRSQKQMRREDMVKMLEARAQAGQ